MAPPKKPSPPVPYNLPHPAVRPSREEVNSAIEAGLTPIIVEGDHMVMLGNPTRIPRIVDEYRYGLRTRIAGMDWNEACDRCRSAPATEERHKANLLIWGYQALCAERDAAAEFVTMAADFREARKAVSDLMSAFRQDGRIMDDVPLPVAIKANIEHCDRHGQTFRDAFRPRKARAADFLREWCGNPLAWMAHSGVLVISADGKDSVYHLNRMSLADLENLEAACAFAADLTAAIEQRGISGVIRQQRQGRRGRPPRLLEAWLVQQGRVDAPKLGPQKLARLLAKHGLSNVSLELMTRRLNESAKVHPEPLRLAIY